MNSIFFEGKEEYLDDATYIKDIRHFPAGPMHQYDILLDAARYGWEYMLDSADYLASSDIKEINEVKTGDLRIQTIDVTDSYHDHNNKCLETPELKCERGFLSVAGNSEAIKAPVKIVWVNQTRAIRMFTFTDDELLVRKYVETVIRRTFGTEDSMKLGKGGSGKETEYSLKTSLFLIPVAYEGETEAPDMPDHELHFGIREAQMAMIDSKLACSDLPASFEPAKVTDSKIMHFQTLKAPDGKRFMPLFTSYSYLTSIFGNNSRIGVICYDTAKEFVLKEQLDGIVVSPGIKNIIIPIAELIYSQKNEPYIDKKDDSCKKDSGLTDKCGANAGTEDLKRLVAGGSVSVSEIAEQIMKIDKCFIRCTEYRVFADSREPVQEHCIRNTAQEITEILKSLDTEEYVDLINAVSDGLGKNISDDHPRSVLPLLIDSYELSMKNILREQADKLCKTARKMEWKVEFIPFNDRWVDGFIHNTEEWVRYARPLIKVAAARETENSYVNESLKCLEKLTNRSLYNNDPAAYKLSAAFAEYFADIPSAMVWIRVDYDLAAGHLSRHKK